MNGEHELPVQANYRQGSPEYNCASCVFFSDGVCDAYDAQVEASMVCDSHQTEEETRGDGDQGNGVGMSEMYCSEGSVKEEDGLIWKTVLKTGKWKYRPDPRQQPIPIPINVIKGKSTNPRHIIGLEDVVEAWDKKAIEHVTIPLTHADRTDENTGWVKQLKIDSDPDRDGHFVLKAGFEFTEPNIKQKILNGSIANTSVGLYYDYIRKDDGVKFPIALAHVALTNRPWINGMRPFGLSEEDAEIKSFEFAEDMSNEATSQTTEVKLEGGLPTTTGTYLVPVTFFSTSTGAETNVTYSFAPRDQWKQEKVEEEVPQKPNRNGDSMKTIPGLEGLELSEEAAARVAAALEEAATQAQAERDAAKAEADRLAAENLALSEEKRERRVESRVNELKEMGFASQPGFLKTVRDILLADDGSNKLELSEDNKKEDLSFTDVVNKLIDALPKKDGKVDFSEQAENLGVEGKPAVDATDENKTAEDKWAEAHEFLYGDKPRSK
jgi:hypothetical protein